MPDFINSFVKFILPFQTPEVLQSMKRAPVISNHEAVMNEETAIGHIEKKIDLHIQRHEEDQKKLFYWAIGILLSLFGTVTTGFVTYGTMQEKVATIEKRQELFVTQQQFNGLSDLLNERLKNMNEKLDNILKAIN